MKGRHLLLSAILVFSSTSHAQSLPENHSVNGGVAIIPLESKEKPDAYFNGKAITVIDSPNPKQWLMVVGIPLDNKRDIQNILLKNLKNAKLPFHVSEKFYPIQSLTISNQRKVDPYAKDKAIIDKQSKQLETLFSSYSNNNPFKEKFIAPTKGPISSLFGLRRLYNKKPRAPHSGLDIAAATGTPVKAASSGTVVEAADYFFTGNTVIVDHGRGVFSLYAHLNEFKVKKGDKIKQGQLVGKVGQTGRVTGPHLHWSMVMNSTLVDPLLFVPAHEIRAPYVAKKKTPSEGVTAEHAN